jgi:probable phosphoglycerate mutase
MAGNSLLDQITQNSLLDAPKASERGSVYLMRHGSTALDVEHRSDGWLDLPLSDKGRLGTIDAQQHLKTVPLKGIYTADLKRTVETADIVKSGTQSDPKVYLDDELKTWNLGVLAGVKKEIGRPLVEQLVATPDVAPDGGESLNEFKERFLPCFEKLAAKATMAAPCLFVLSGSNLRTLGQEWLDDSEKLDLDEGGLAVCRYTAGQWNVDVLFGHEDAAHHVS